MFRKITITVLCFAIAISVACSSSTPEETKDTKKADTKKLPEGLEVKQIKPDGKTTPGIPNPDDAKLKQIKPDGKTTPGIPDPKDVGKTPVPKGATPTPGIPSPEELKKQRERKVSIDDVNKPKEGAKPPADKDKEVTSPIDRKRRAGKPSN